MSKMLASLEEGGMTDTYTLGREYSVAEAIVIARRATFDPGVFTPRLADHNGPEELHVWQARALLIALGSHGPSFEHQWGNLDQAVRNTSVEVTASVTSPSKAAA